MTCSECDRRPALKEGLCRDCYRYASWKGTEGPGKDLRAMIKEDNERKARKEKTGV